MPLVEAPPVCGRVDRDEVCAERGDHFCVPRATYVVRFFETVLCHTKGKWARKPFILTKWQREDIIEPLFGQVEWFEEDQCYRRQFQIGWVEIARKSGKALALNEEIPTPNGWTTMGQLEAGDEIFDGQGRPCRVVAAHPVEMPERAYRIDFAQSGSVKCNAEHLWVTRHQYTQRAETRTTQDIVDTFRRGARNDRMHSIPAPPLLDLPERELPIDPYVLGIWLADGCNADARVTKPDHEVWENIEAAGYELGKRLTKTNGCRAHTVRGLITQLREQGLLHNKHIPTEYLRAGTEQRWRLVQGLMDGDGYCSEPDHYGTTRIEYCSIDERLAEDVLELVRTLGFKASIKKGTATLDGVDMGPKYRVCFSAFEHQPVFTVERKRARLQPMKQGKRLRSQTRMLEEFEEIAPEPMRCITVDSHDGQFLTGRGFIQTHNSELLAGIVLYLLIADGEEQAEIYGAAGTRDQARLVFDVASRMVQLSSLLRKRVDIKESAKRLVYKQTASFYQCISADAGTALGLNPHGVVFDEVLVQPNGDLWDALRTAFGARTQPLLVGATTAGNDLTSFAAQQHEYCLQVSERPEMDRRRHSIIYNVPQHVDPFDESQWHLASPALGDFLSIQAYRDEAQEAQQNPAREQAFRQFRLNQWTSSSDRMFSSAQWDRAAGMVAEEDLFRQEAYCGLNLQTTTGITSWVMAFPYHLRGVDGDGNETEGPGYKVIPRFWIPESGLRELGMVEAQFRQWAREGLIKVTEGDVIDYETIQSDLAADVSRFDLKEFAYAPWESEQVRQALEEMRPDLDPFGWKCSMTMGTMAAPTEELFRLLGRGLIHHGGHPVLRFQAQSTTPDTDSQGRVKPSVKLSTQNISGVSALVLALAAATRERDVVLEGGFVAL